MPRATLVECKTLPQKLRENDVDGVRRLLDRGCDPNERTHSYIPCLTTAIRHCVAAIEPLLAANADIWATDVYGRTPLHAAVIANNLGAVRQLCRSIQEDQATLCWFYTEPRIHIYSVLRRTIIQMVSNKKTLTEYLNTPDCVHHAPATHLTTTSRMAKLLCRFGSVDVDYVSTFGSLREFGTWRWMFP